MEIRVVMGLDFVSMLLESTSKACTKFRISTTEEDDYFVAIFAVDGEHIPRCLNEF